MKHHGEIIVKERVVTHFVVNNLIRDSQHGFRNKRSCFTSLLNFFAQEIAVDETDNTKAVDLVYLDLRKAFDKVPQEILMAKVNAHGILGDAAR